MTQCCEVVVTAPDREWLADLATKLIERRLVAAGHLSEIRSIYRWDGIQDTTETRLALHTRTDLAEQVISFVREVHPYQVPGIWTLPIVGGTPDYLAWIEEATIDPEGP